MVVCVGWTSRLSSDLTEVMEIDKRRTCEGSNFQLRTFPICLSRNNSNRPDGSDSDESVASTILLSKTESSDLGNKPLHTFNTPFAAYALLERPADWEFHSDSEAEDKVEDLDANGCPPLSPAPSRTLAVPSWLPPPPKMQFENPCSFFDDVGTDSRPKVIDWHTDPLQYLMGAGLVAPAFCTLSLP
eukprot:jgi/Botrbrau1/20810/Bobra.0156s0038.2